MTNKKLYFDCTDTEVKHYIDTYCEFNNITLLSYTLSNGFAIVNGLDQLYGNNFIQCILDGYELDNIFVYPS